MARCETDRAAIAGGRRPRLEAAARLGAALLVFMPVLGACKPLDDTLAAVPIFAFMRSSPALGPYEAPRPAPPGTVPSASPVEVLLPPIEPREVDLIAFGEVYENPYPMTPEVIEAGRAVYERNCLVCHGPTGAGDGPIVRPGVYPALAPAFDTPRVVNRSDGFLYGVVRVGISLMPPYGDRITHAERWWVVNYIRYLQQQAGALPAAP